MSQLEIGIVMGLLLCFLVVFLMIVINQNMTTIYVLPNIDFGKDDCSPPRRRK